MSVVAVVATRRRRRSPHLHGTAADNDDEGDLDHLPLPDASAAHYAGNIDVHPDIINTLGAKKKQEALIGQYLGRKGASVPWRSVLITYSDPKYLAFCRVFLNIYLLLDSTVLLFLALGLPSVLEGRCDLREEFYTVDSEYDVLYDEIEEINPEVDFNMELHTEILWGCHELLDKRFSIYLMCIFLAITTYITLSYLMSLDHHDGVGMSILDGRIGMTKLMRSIYYRQWHFHSFVIFVMFMLTGILTWLLLEDVDLSRILQGTTAQSYCEPLRGTNEALQILAVLNFSAGGLQLVTYVMLSWTNSIHWPKTHRQIKEVKKVCEALELMPEFKKKKLAVERRYSMKRFLPWVWDGRKEPSKPGRNAIVPAVGTAKRALPEAPEEDPVLTSKMFKKSLSEKLGNDPLNQQLHHYKNWCLDNYGVVPYVINERSLRIFLTPGYDPSSCWKMKLPRPAQKQGCQGLSENYTEVAIKDEPHLSIDFTMNQSEIAHLKATEVRRRKRRDTITQGYGVKVLNGNRQHGIPKGKLFNVNYQDTNYMRFALVVLNVVLIYASSVLLFLVLEIGNIANFECDIRSQVDSLDASFNFDCHHINRNADQVFKEVGEDAEHTFDFRRQYQEFIWRCDDMQDRSNFIYIIAVILLLSVILCFYLEQKIEIGLRFSDSIRAGNLTVPNLLEAMSYRWNHHHIFVALLCLLLCFICGVVTQSQITIESEGTVAEHCNNIYGYEYALAIVIHFSWIAAIGIVGSYLLMRYVGEIKAVRQRKEASSLVKLLTAMHLENEYDIDMNLRSCMGLRPIKVPHSLRRISPSEDIFYRHLLLHQARMIDLYDLDVFELTGKHIRVFVPDDYDPPSGDADVRFHITKHKYLPVRWLNR
eukprot:Clim_evm24s239 gene=Clim_evmTU24s239